MLAFEDKAAVAVSTTAACSRFREFFVSTRWRTKMRQTLVLCLMLCMTADIACAVSVAELAIVLTTQ
jgi:hypothetical protein